MTNLILLLTLYSTLTTIALIKYYRKNEINYSNNQNCLRALAEYDSRLKEKLNNEANRNMMIAELNKTIKKVDTQYKNRVYTEEELKELVG